MKIIDLNENGVKLISSTRKQIYLTLNDIKEVLKSNYILQNNTFKIIIYPFYLIFFYLLYISRHLPLFANHPK